MRTLKLFTITAIALMAMTSCFFSSAGDGKNWDNCSGWENNDPGWCGEGVDCDPGCLDNCPADCPEGECCPDGACSTNCQGAPVTTDVVDPPEEDVSVSIGEDVAEPDTAEPDTAEPDVEPPCEKTEGLPKKSSDPCVFDVECGDGMICVDSECHKSCAEDEECPALQVCNGIFCFTDHDGDPQCIFDSECGEGSYCINGMCTAGCELNADCSDYEICKSGICQPDKSKTVECACDCDCDGGTCLNGVCFDPCETDTDCPDGEQCYPNKVCGFPEEVIHECDTSTDCACHDACINGFCVTLP